MREYHEITIEFLTTRYGSVAASPAWDADRLDEIIRQWLEQKAEEIAGSAMSFYGKSPLAIQSKNREILDLVQKESDFEKEMKAHAHNLNLKPSPVAEREESFSDMTNCVLPLNKPIVLEKTAGGRIGYKEYPPAEKPVTEIPDVKCNGKNCREFYIEGVFKDCCVWCGKKQAEKPRTLELWEVLRDAGNVTYWSDDLWKQVAEGGRKWFREKVERWAGRIHTDGVSAKDELLREIKSNATNIKLWESARPSE